MADFAKLVTSASLSAAARELNLSPAMVSRRLAALEARLGVRLVNRTTCSVHLTDEGAQPFGVGYHARLHSAIGNRLATLRHDRPGKRPDRH